MDETGFEWFYFKTASVSSSHLFYKHVVGLDENTRINLIRASQVSCWLPLETLSMWLSDTKFFTINWHNLLHYFDLSQALINSLLIKSAL